MLKAASKSKYPKSLISDLKGQMEVFPQNALEEVGGSQFRKIVGFMFLLICTAGLVYLAYNAFKYSNPPTSMEEIPLVKADHTPVRVLPIDPGGEQVLNQDKLIYNNLQDPHFKRDKKPDAQIEDEMRPRDASLRSPKQAAVASPQQRVLAKNPFEVLDEER